MSKDVQFELIFLRTTNVSLNKENDEFVVISDEEHGI